MSRRRDPERRHIVVVRHAKSSWDDASAPDHDRPLSKRGRRALVPLGEHIAALRLKTDVVLCSSSRRTRDTLDGIRSALRPGVRVEISLALYAATSGQLLAELQRLDADVGTVILIAHNPGVADLVVLLAAQPADGGAVIDRFPTAAVAVLFTDEPWDALRPGAATLESFWTPREAP